MKLHSLFLVLAAAGFSCSTLADVTVNLPNNAELVLVNGASAKGNDPITLPNGENQIALRYNGNFRQGGDFQAFESDVVIMKFAGDNATYTLTMPQIRNEQQADNFNEKPQISLKNAQGNNVSFDQDKLMKKGFQIGRNYEVEIAKYNQTNGPAALASLPSVVVLPATINPADYPATQKGKAQETAAKMLSYWWSQADATTREAFKKKIQ
ncbi:DUF2057 domain-containing protein [Photobacterium damselae]|uniref:YccT family protein n=1 Tax=Photobacterium damselae TaxID=38293 RepID=UPI0010FD3CE3|nr:DUF2057 domain-containing protein [Photobacterium damselae]TLS74232.1 DUF2057 domain-containing protein [Photobacterium damselae subsp. damselae]TLS85575.1 DUF2057 domain-containing protein [Photobacterium damselae subsp. damselae]